MTSVNDKWITYMGFARKSGNLLWGSNTLLYSLSSSRKPYLVIICDEVGENTRKKILKACDKAHVMCLQKGSCVTLSERLGLINKGVFGISDENLAKAIISSLELNNL